MGDWSWTVDPIAIVAAGLVIARVVRRVERRFSRFHEDWEGTPGRPGVPPRAGVMERLSMIEVSQVDMRHDVDVIKRKLANDE